MRPTAVVVDDHPAFRRMAARILLAAGFDVVAEAAGAAEAVDVVRRHRPDFVLVDVLLPDGSGIDAADRIRSAGGGGPSVLLTSSRPAADLGPALRGLDFLAKADLTVDRLAARCRPAGASWTGRPAR